MKLIVSRPSTISNYVFFNFLDSRGDGDNQVMYTASEILSKHGFEIVKCRDFEFYADSYVSDEEREEDETFGMYKEDAVDFEKLLKPYWKSKIEKSKFGNTLIDYDNYELKPREFVSLASKVQMNPSRRGDNLGRKLGITEMKFLSYEDFQQL